MKMHDFSRAPSGDLLLSMRAVTIPGVAKLNAPAVPNCSNRRREME
jgi:hypothetical protein